MTQLYFQCSAYRIPSILRQKCRMNLWSVPGYRMFSCPGPPPSIITSQTEKYFHWLKNTHLWFDVRVCGKIRVGVEKSHSGCKNHTLTEKIMIWVEKSAVCLKNHHLINTAKNQILPWNFDQKYAFKSTFFEKGAKNPPKIRVFSKLSKFSPLNPRFWGKVQQI